MANILDEIATLFVAYYRVSDKKQGDGKKSGTGYGIEAQIRDVEHLRAFRGATIIEASRRSSRAATTAAPSCGPRSPSAKRLAQRWSWRSWTGWREA